MSKLCLLLLFSVGLLKAGGQAGSLDSTFGNNGIQTTAFLSNANILYEDGRQVLTSANRDIFIVVQIPYSSYTRIAKYLPDGRLDASFGNVGYSNVINLFFSGAALQGDKIIVVGSSNSDFALTRYTADGILDSSFGENGIVTTDFDNSDDFAPSIVLQGDKIIAAGSTYNPDGSYDDFALARYMADGTLDPSFGEHGKVITDFNNSEDRANSITLQADKIIVGGNTSDPVNGDNDFALVRYTADGILDSSFGENGKVATDFNNSYDVANSIALQGDMIIVSGSTYNPDDNNIDFALARYTADGVLDSSFGENGKVTTDFNNSSDGANSMAIQGTKIIVAGYTQDLVNFSSDFALVRYTADGILDSSFGENGKVATDFNNSDDGTNSIALEGDKIIVGGYTSANGTNDFALARYTAYGVLDDSFGVNGLLTGYFSTSQTRFTGTVIQGNKIIAAGYAINDSNNSDFVLARYTADGILDSSFGEYGKVMIDFNNQNNIANAIALQGDKIIVGGSELARYTADGMLDSSFGINGITKAGGNAMALQGDKIIMAGEALNPVDESSDFGLSRYTADGKLDSSFGINGRVRTDIKSTYDNFANSVAIQGDKIIVGGSTGGFEGSDFALARYTADGTLDSIFGENGKVITDFNGPFDDARSIVIQGDKIIAAGYSTDEGFNQSDYALARYTADGASDSSFGENGKVRTVFSSYMEPRSIALQGSKIIVGGSALIRYMANGVLDSSFGENGIAKTYLGIQDIALHENRLYAVGETYNGYEFYGVLAAYQLEASQPTISIADITVLESKKLAVATVRLSAPATRWVRIRYTTLDKTAMYPQDYLHVKGNLLFAPGVTKAKVYIPIVHDSKYENNEQFDVRLTNAWNATILDSVGVVTIIDDDAWITKQNTSLRIDVSPNPSAGAFSVQLQGSNLKQPVSVRIYDVSGRLLIERENISIGQSLRLGDQYKTGTYFIEAVQGNRSVHTKVIKTDK